MSGGKGIIFTLIGRGERPESAQLAVGAEAVTSSGKDLMTICLMPYIPYDTVIRGVEYIMQSYSKFKWPEGETYLEC